MKKIKCIKVCTLKIEEPSGQQFEVLHVNVISDEFVYFTKNGLYIGTRKGCTKLDQVPKP